MIEHDASGRSDSTAPDRTQPELAIIAAVAANGVIGVDNRLPWHLPADLRRFRALTTGHAIIMGRKTFESIGRVLPQRQNIVVTRSPDYDAPGARTAHSLRAALAQVALPSPAFCIGGAALYVEALPLASTLYLTELARAYAGDARFPDFDRALWREMSREEQSPDPSGAGEYAFVTYLRTSR